MKVLDKYDIVEIIQEEDEATPIYKLSPPKLTKAEEQRINEYKNLLTQSDVRVMREEVDMSMRWELMRQKAIEKLPKSDNRGYVARKIVGMAMGYGEISLLIDDDNLEEVMVNGVNTPVYVYHRKFGMCKTNIVFASTESINKLVQKLCYVNNKDLAPVVDIAAIDGCRINITSEPLPSKGSTLTIRKQRRKVFSIIELIEQGTLSPELCAFMWLAVEGMKLTPANLLIAGSVGSGKTTTLNAICTFIPPNERVVTIEDTFELNIDNIENKVQMESNKEYDMDALLRDSLRMRPDRVMVGEIRGKEAITLFNAMNIGRIGMGTVHSSSSRDVTTRLESEPMNVPAPVIGSLDLILVQNRFVHDGQIIRRVTEVTEVTGAIKDTIMMGQIYEWDPKTDTVKRKKEQNLATPILFFDKLSEATKLTKAAIMKEMDLRQAVIEYMMRKGIKEQKDVSNFIKRFYLDLEGLITEIPNLFTDRAIKAEEEPKGK